MITEERKYPNLKWFVILVVVVISIFLVWLIFYSFDDCKTQECFDEHLKDCSRSVFVGGDEMIFMYTIMGESGSACEVAVELLQGELNSEDSLKLENQEMVCMLPKGVVVAPSEDISKCHGLLKEGLQDLMIKKLHIYLVKNLGRINLEILDVPMVS